MMQNGIQAQADTLVAAGRIGDAYRLLSGAAAAANSDAIFVLACWRLSGQFIRRDLAASRYFFRRAAAAGHTQAVRIYAAFAAAGVGGSADWAGVLAILRQFAVDDLEARQQIAMIDAMALTPAGEPLDLPDEERLSEQPHVSAFRALFTPDECDFLVAQAVPWLSPSLVVDPRTGEQVRNPIRTSDNMAFPYVEENPAIHALNRRIAAISRTQVSQGEPLQVLRYREGQEYRPHSDALAGEPNQRILTVLVYLNEGYEGGETLFLKTGLRFKGRKGDALLFRNSLPDRRADELAQHAGLPVTAGEKMIASRWIRERPFSLPAPRPILDV